MPASARCGRCGAPSATFATEGFCSACMLEVALESGPVSADMERPMPLQRLGDYELLEEIARGGMGVVFKARQISLGRVVALKMILTGRLASEVEIRRFRDEARAAAALRHPNIVAIHEVGEIDGQPYFSMDLVEGRNLAEAVREGPFTPARAAACVRTVAEAIHYAHEHGILHRDLKPSNVLLDVEDHPHVTDFGLAKQMVAAETTVASSPSPGAADKVSAKDKSISGRGEGGRSTASRPALGQSLLTSAATDGLTVSGQVLGSPNFMPPEQAAGRHRDLTQAADVYSLGALLYHLLTGRPPFLADSVPATLRLVAETEPVAPKLLNPGIPRDLETICLKCMDKDPRRRYSTAQVLAEELARFQRDEPIQARPVGRWEKFHRWMRRHPVIAMMTGVIGVLLIAVAVISAVAAARLQRASREGQERLREAYLSQARANRWSGRPGRRFNSLDAIAKAALIRPGMDLRNEAIAAMALVDLREAKQWKKVHGFDSPIERYAHCETNGTIVVRRVPDDAELCRVPGFGLPVFDGVTFSPNGRWIAAHYRDGSTYDFKVFDLHRGASTSVDLPGRWVRCFPFLPDGRRLAVAWATYVKRKRTPTTITFYDLETGQELNSVPVSNLPSDVVFDPNSTRMAVSSSESHRVQIYSVADGQELQTLVHSNHVTGLSWSTDGRRLAAACADRSVYLWDMLQKPALPTLLSHEGETIWCHFTQRGDMLMSWGWNLIAKIWNVESGKELLRLPADSVGSFSADDRWLHVNRVPTAASISEFADGRECRPYHFKSKIGASYAVMLGRDGRWMASGHRDGLRFWNLATGRETHFPEFGDTRHLRLSPDGQSLITQSAKELLSWPVRSREEDGVTRIEIGPPFGMSQEKPPSTEPTNRMAVGSGDRICIFDAPTLSVVRWIRASGPVDITAMSTDGRHCAIWVRNAPTVDIYDADDGHLITSLAVPQSPCVGFSPDGRWLITGSGEEYRFWERSSWKLRKSIPRGQTGGTHGKFAFTPDGRMVALAVGRGEVGLFDTFAFEALAILESPEVGNVAGLAFGNNGAQLAVSTSLKSIHVWNLRLIRRQLAELKLDYAAPSLASAAFDDRPTELTVTGKPGASSRNLQFPPRDARCTGSQIDLTRHYNAVLTNGWFYPKWTNIYLSGLPQGLVELDGMSFDVRGVIQVGRNDPAFAYPSEVAGIPVHQPCQKLHFLHATGWGGRVGEDVGEYVVRYEDRAERSIPITYQENIWCWWDELLAIPPLKPDTTVVWRGNNPMSRMDLVLFHFRWENPRPDVPIASITFRSRMTQCAPFLVALTAE